MNAAWELFIRTDRIRELSEATIVWSIKGTLILALAGATAWLLRRSTARVRHLAWALAIVGVLVLPGVEGVIPGWSIQGLLPGIETPEEAPTVVVEPTPAPTAKSEQCTGAGAVVGESRVPPSASGAEGTARTASAGVAPASVEGAGSWNLASLPPLLFAVWILGAVGLALHPLAGILGRRRLLSRARPAGSAARELLDTLRGELGISRSVRLVRVPEAVIPMTWGTLRPVIVLPDGAEGWPRSRLRHVLLHELAHVARCDACLFGAARLLCVVRWFDPLSWYAARRLRAEAELACDDRVLLADDRAALYAGYLLECLREARAGAPAGAIAMARRSQLGSRIESILEPGRRLRSSRRGLLAAGIAAAAVLIPLSAVTLSEPPPPPELPEAPPAPEWSWSAPTAAGLPTPDAPLPDTPEPPAPVPSGAQVAPAAEPESPAPEVPPPPGEATVPSVPEAPLPAGPAATPSVPAPPAVVSTAVGPGSSRNVSLHVSGDGRGGFFDHPHYERACDGRWPGIGDRSSSRRIRSDDDQWDIEIEHAGCSLGVELRGDVRLEMIGGGIETLGRGARVRIEEETDTGTRVLRVTPGPGGEPRYHHRVDGAEAPVDASVRSWLARVTAEIFRITGLQAEERVAAILRRRGVEGVLRETGRISSDHVHRVYASRLLAEAELSDVQLGRLLEQAGQRIGSDHEMAELLIEAVPRIESPSTRNAFVGAAATVGSDHEARRVLEALAEGRELDAGSLRLLLAVARGIGSDFEMAEALRTVLDRWPGGEPLPAGLFRAVKTIGSDYEARRVLTAVPRKQLDASGRKAFLQAARTIGSDFEMAELLITVARESPGPLPPAFFEAFSTVGSDFEARRVLQTVIVERDPSPDELLAVLESSRSIGSDHELSELLVRIGRRYDLEGPARDAFLDASKTVGSSRDRERIFRTILGG